MTLGTVSPSADVKLGQGSLEKAGREVQKVEKSFTKLRKEEIKWQ